MIRKDHIFLISKRKNNHKKIVGRLRRQYPAYEHISKAVRLAQTTIWRGRISKQIIHSIHIFQNPDIIQTFLYCSKGQLLFPFIGLEIYWHNQRNVASNI